MPTTTTTKTMNVRLPVAIFNQLEQLAQATDRSKSYLAINALQRYLQQEAWQINDIKAGLAEADQGDFASDAEVAQAFKQFGA